MFAKLLIANRGEIACRIIRTARRMGISTVAVFSEADRDGLHVEMADEAVAIGPPPAAQSYLLADKIIEAVRKTGADAVHPGFGFLSEKASFAEALEREGIGFVGPNPRAIAAMGDKIESKKLASEAGVSTVPGYLGVIADAGEAVAIARDIGYPVMIKASAGGGGKGMRIAASEAEVREGFERARGEARSSFGDDRVFIEKFIVEPRHIEIQVLGDKHGSIVHLGERECSIQRRHQKVIEEAPSPFVTEEVRAAMGAEAVALARAVGYDSAGTVEFIMGPDRRFYFLEMNTRLQVEHPVTELVTGFDIVEQMLRVAAGEKLAFGQDEVAIKGSAVECRLYAEDPYRNFLPSTGRLTRYRPPAEGVRDGLTTRIDAGVAEGGEISIYYDPMIAKLVTHGPTRIAAIDHMIEALDAFRIDGIRHNLPFLATVMRHERFREGRLSTGFIAEEFPEGFSGRVPAAAERQALYAIAAFVHVRLSKRARNISGQIRPDHPPTSEGRWIVTSGRTQVEVEITNSGEKVTVAFPGASRNAKKLAVTSAWKPGEPVFKGEVGGETYHVAVDIAQSGYRVRHGGAELALAFDRPGVAALLAFMPEKVAADTSKYLRCPMPGILVSVSAHAGQEVKAGEAMAVVEAMKMENILRAERDGTVAKVHAAPGASLAVDDVILEFAEAKG
ncbi:MAG: acetyl/propionyl/methylcrotonyl-CoA carboxylase subunit alpha [Alphaproteobacteria bacterium]|nr:acetyl/propionyl/methylcrotonyl-CoA carboxylase subunit alpha [Alphaproteobacteria bacterium]